MDYYGDFTLRDLPRGLGTGESAADDMNRAVRRVLHSAITRAAATGRQVVCGGSRVFRAAVCVMTLVLAAAFGPAQGASVSKDDVVSATYGDVSIAAPSSSQITICHGFGCKLTAELQLDSSDRAQLARLMAPGRGSAEAERRAVAAAGAWFDKRIAPLAGTTNHIARAGPEHVLDSARQFDCIDTSRNMTSLLLVLDELKLLRHHTPDVPVARGYFLDLRYPHATAVLTEKARGESYSVDAWTRRYGQPPEIMPLERWKGLGGLR